MSPGYVDHGHRHGPGGTDPVVGVGTGAELDIKVAMDSVPMSTGDGKFVFAVPADLNGLNLVDAQAYVSTVSSSGLVTVQIRNVTQAADMLSTRVTIDVGEFTSYAAATPSVVDTANDDVATGDLVAIDVDVAGTGTRGLGVILRFDSSPGGMGAKGEPGDPGATGATGAAGADGLYATVQDEGSSLTARTVLNFVGAGVTATDTGTKTEVNIPGGGGGSLVLLEQHTASSSATLNFASFISSTYDEYMFEFVNVIPATNNAKLLCRIGTGGGPTYDSGANYGWYERSMRTAGDVSTGPTSGATSMQFAGVTVGVSSNTLYGVSGTLRLASPQSTSLYKQFYGQTFWYYDAGADQVVSVTMGTYRATTAVTAVQFLFSTGNIASGTIRIYGIAK